MATRRVEESLRLRDTSAHRWLDAGPRLRRRQRWIGVSVFFPGPILKKTKWTIKRRYELRRQGEND